MMRPILVRGTFLGERTGVLVEGDRAAELFLLSLAGEGNVFRMARQGDPELTGGRGPRFWAPVERSDFGPENEAERMTAPNIGPLTEANQYARLVPSPFPRIHVKDAFVTR